MLFEKKDGILYIFFNKLPKILLKIVKTIVWFISFLIISYNLDIMFNSMQNINQVLNNNTKKPKTTRLKAKTKALIIEHMSNKNNLLDHTKRSKEDVLKFLTIARTNLIGANTILYLLWKYKGDLGAILAHLKQNNYAIPKEDDIVREYNLTVRFGGYFLFPGDRLFPNDVYSSCLIYKGNIKLLNGCRRLAVIGSRNISPKGEILCRNFVNDWNIRGFTIVSGLAIGTDSIALSLSDNPIGVLPCGLGVYYPLSNKRLQEKIETTGLIITEFPFGTKITKSSFPRRNVLIAAIAQKIVVIEATSHSGTMSTVVRAEMIKKPIFVVPGHPSDLQYAGSNDMLRHDHINILLHPSEISFKTSKLNRKYRFFFANIDAYQVQQVHSFINKKYTLKNILKYYNAAMINSAVAMIEILYRKNLHKFYITA